MNSLNITELSQYELVTINGGENEESYEAGYAAGQVIGKMAKNFLTLVGIYKLLILL